MKDTQKSTITTNTKQHLEVFGAKEHNLKNINISIPKNEFVVITGLSGSGKSSLAFDTIYAEGQRRYIETFSAYARQFIGGLKRPKVDKIKGLSPVISIEQKTTNKNPRSTVGTITEIYDFLRLLYSRVAIAYSLETGEKMTSYSDNQILEIVLKDFNTQRISILSPVVRSRKGHYRELLEEILKQGFIKARIDGEILELEEGMKLDRFKTHDVEVIIDVLKISSKNKDRISQSIKTAMKYGKGLIMVMTEPNLSTRYFSRSLMCPTTGISYPQPEPNNFSFNSPKGACLKCNGLGYISKIDINKILPDQKLSIKYGGIAPISGKKSDWILEQLEIIGKKYHFDLSTPIREISKSGLNAILYGMKDSFEIVMKNIGIKKTYNIDFEGITTFIFEQYQTSPSLKIKRWAKKFMYEIKCETCFGNRLKIESQYFKIDGKNISEISNMDISTLQKWIDNLNDKLSKNQQIIAEEILKELKKRILFLINVGLEYLSLNRSSQTLSGGESQRIRLATQIGSQLTDVLYILDEPSIGLHQRDNQKLITTLKNLRDLGNSIIVIEHDKDIMLESDYIIDLGPGAGINGGEIIAKGNIKKFIKNNSLTANYLNKIKQIKTPTERRPGNGKFITIKGAQGNNLKNINVTFPLGKFICVTGVSGSGKSSLINKTLYPIMNHYFYNAVKDPLKYDSIEGLENIDKVIEVNQSPIGRTPRSNPATYTGMFSDIRSLFSNLQESKIRGYKPGRFSFNVSGGRCESCKGAGLKTIEMNFLPDVHVNCQDCHGKRYNRETLEIKYKGKSIADVLDMTIDNAIDFFKNIPSINRRIETLQKVGLGYIKLGQQSTTLSGGEAQRIKLSTELSKKDTGKTFYILDEPTTGLHFHDIQVLLEVLNQLLEKGNTILVIEHNMDVIKMADHVIDIGPEGGLHGGQLIYSGNPENLIKHNKSYTGSYLISEL